MSYSSKFNTRSTEMRLKFIMPRIDMLDEREQERMRDIQKQLKQGGKIYPNEVSAVENAYERIMRKMGLPAISQKHDLRRRF